MREKDWQIYQQYERDVKRTTLRTLSARDGFKQFVQLYEFARGAGLLPARPKLDWAHIRALSEIRSLFAKVK